MGCPPTAPGTCFARRITGMGRSGGQAVHHGPVHGARAPPPPLRPCCARALHKQAAGGGRSLKKKDGEKKRTPSRT